jgi:acetylglutamate kinase
VTAHRILVKVGGATLDDPGSRGRFAESVARAVAAGDEVAVVHGGGAQVSRMTAALGLVPQRVRGLRVTDDETARVVLQVLAGEVNALLVAALQAAGADAIGVSGADGGLFKAAPQDPALGRVGTVVHADGAVLERILGAGFVPVIATVAPAPGETDVFLNVNADAAVAPLASAWRADMVLFLSDVAHVQDHGERVESLDRAAFEALETDGVIVGGMLPKVEAALDAADALPEALVKIATAFASDPIAAAVQTSHGTLLTAQVRSLSNG